MNKIIRILMSFTVVLSSIYGYAQNGNDNNSKPVIKNVTILKKEINTLNPNYYNLHYTVEYYGCEKLTISIEEDYNSLVMTSYITEYPIANIVSENISSNYYAWIDIEASNEYGTDIYTIELPPFSTPTAVSDVRNNVFTHIHVYNLSGTKIQSFESKDDLQTLPQGVYILNLYNKNKLIKKVKYYKQ